MTPPQIVINIQNALLELAANSEQLTCDGTSFPPGLCARERAMIVAALRHWQESVVKNSALPRQYRQLDGMEPLSLDEINCLVNRLTKRKDPCECESPGYYWSGVPGILARIENGRLVLGAKVERCDLCRRFASDESARRHLVELGRA